MRSRQIVTHHPRLDLSVDITEHELKLRWALVDDGALDSDSTKVEWTDKKFTVSQFNSRRDWKAGSTFLILLDQYSGRYVGIMNGSAETYAARKEPKDMVRFVPREYFCPIQVTVPFETANFVQMGYQVFQSAESLFRSNDAFAVCESDIPYLSRTQVRDFLPKLQVSGPGTVKEGELTSFDVYATSFGTALTEPLTVYLSATAGYLPKDRLTLLNGSGKFQWRALDLSAGDTGELRVGFRFLSSRATHDIEVVS